MSTALIVTDDDGETVRFDVQGLDRAAWAGLLHAHPTDDPTLRYNPATLNPALVAACVLNPTVDPAWAVTLLDDPDVGGDLLALCLRLSDPGSWAWATRRLDTDARLAAEVAASVRMGISHAQFTGWPATSQDLALAHLDAAARVCPGCGIPEADMRRPTAWEPDMRECWHCDQLQTARQQIPAEHQHKVHLQLVRPDPEGA